MSIESAALSVLCVIVGAWLFSKVGRKAGIAILVVVALLGCVYEVIHSIQSFTGTKLVATVQASPVSNAPHTMAVSLTTYDSAGNPTRAEYELGGDRWEMNCSVVRYYDWVAYIGLQSAYSCDRLTSQYDDSNSHTIQPVALPRGTMFAIPFLERAHYTNGVIDPTGNYNIYVTTSGDVYAQNA